MYLALVGKKLNTMYVRIVEFLSLSKINNIIFLKIYMDML